MSLSIKPIERPADVLTSDQAPFAAVSVIVPVTDGRLDFGPWQRVFYGEWDGMRKKRVIVKVMGE